MCLDFIVGKKGQFKNGNSLSVLNNLNLSTVKQDEKRNKCIQF